MFLQSFTFFYTQTRMRNGWGSEHMSIRVRFLHKICVFVFSEKNRKDSLWYFCEWKAICLGERAQNEWMGVRVVRWACVCVYNIFAIIFSWAPDVRTLIEIVSYYVYTPYYVVVSHLLRYFNTLKHSLRCRANGDEKNETNTKDRGRKKGKSLNRNRNKMEWNQWNMAEFCCKLYTIIWYEFNFVFFCLQIELHTLYEEARMSVHVGVCMCVCEETGFDTWAMCQCW